MKMRKNKFEKLMNYSTVLFDDVKQMSQEQRAQYYAKHKYANVLWDDEDGEVQSTELYKFVKEDGTMFRNPWYWRGL